MELHEINTKLCEALGVETSCVNKVVLELTPDDFPLLTITKSNFDLDPEVVKEVVETYHLSPSAPPNAEEIHQSQDKSFATGIYGTLSDWYSRNVRGIKNEAE